MQTHSLGSAAICLKSSWRDGFYSPRFMSWCNSMWHWELIHWDGRPSFNLLYDRNMVLSHNSRHWSHTSGNLDGSLKNQACSGGNASGPLVSDLWRKQIRSIHCNLVTFFFNSFILLLPSGSSERFSKSSDPDSNLVKSVKHFDLESHSD